MLASICVVLGVVFLAARKPLGRLAGRSGGTVEGNQRYFLIVGVLSVAVGAILFVIGER